MQQFEVTGLMVVVSPEKVAKGPLCNVLKVSPVKDSYLYLSVWSSFALTRKSSCFKSW